MRTVRRDVGEDADCAGLGAARRVAVKIGSSSARPRSGRWSGVLLLAVGLGVAGCTGTVAGGAGSAVPDADPGQTVPFEAADLSFFRSTVLVGPLLAPPPRDLHEAVQVATTVVVAEVADVRATRTLVGETEDDQLEMLGVVIRPTEILHGQLAANVDEIVVEFLTAAARADAVAAMRSSLPPGPAVWFLQEADIGDLQVRDVVTPTERYYGVIHLRAGVFVQGPDRVVAGPWPGDPAEPARASPELRSMRTQAESFATLDDLLAYLRTIG